MNKFYPNTKIEPKRLTDQQLRKIREIYDASGLTCDKDFLVEDGEADSINREIEDYGRSERRLHRSGEFKIHFEPSRDGEGEKYLRIYVGIPTHWYKGLQRRSMEKSIKKFDEDVRKEFYTI